MDPATAGIEAAELFAGEDADTITNVLADVLEAATTADGVLFPAIISGLVDELNSSAADLVLFLSDAIHRRRAAMASVPFAHWLINTPGSEPRELKALAVGPDWPHDATTMTELRVYVEKENLARPNADLETQFIQAWERYRNAVAGYGVTGSTTFEDQFRLVCRWPDGHQETVDLPLGGESSPRLVAERMAGRHNESGRNLSTAVVQRRCAVMGPWFD